MLKKGRRKGWQTKEIQMVDCFLVTVQAYSSPQVQSLGCIMLCYTNPTSLRTENNLLLVASLETAGLGVQVVVARKSSNQRTFRSVASGAVLPLNGPLHGSVGDDEGRHNVENLLAETTEGVEDGGVSGTGEGTLTVRGQRVGGDALGGRAACECDISDRVELVNPAMSLCVFSSIMVVVFPAMSKIGSACVPTHSKGSRVIVNVPNSPQTPMKL
jgi:hypothetical protein